jgi:hypothetical protein
VGIPYLPKEAEGMKYTPMLPPPPTGAPRIADSG